MKTSKKSEVIMRLYKHCFRRGDFTFHNDLVKAVCTKVGFGNPFDATKIDNKDKLPPLLQKEDVALIHLGSGNHRFVKGINLVYHDFEPIQKTVHWCYRKSLLNQFNSSESNLLSVANNQRILHHFLFADNADDAYVEFLNADIAKRAKFYFPYYVKYSSSHFLGGRLLNSKNIQIKIGLTVEFQSNIGVLEHKSNVSNFSVYRLYYPLLYYYRQKQKSDIRDIYGVYAARENNTAGNTLIKFWHYAFSDMSDVTSIKFIKSSCYELIN